MVQNKVDWSTGSAAGLNLEQTHNAVWSSMEKHVDVIKPEDIELGVALGEGQFAMTYKATVLKDLRLIKKGQEVAVKRVKGFSPDAVFKEVLCLHTLSYGESINHSTQEDTSLDAQYVVKLLGFNAEVVPYFIVMELVDGDTLHAEMEKRGAALPLRMTLALTKDMLLGLQHAQCRNIVHRDIKSLNIMLCNQERKLQVSDSKEVYQQPGGGEYPMAKIVDWGECAAMSTNQDRTNEVGTLRWMAPEVMGMGGNCAGYGAPVDLYSLSGIIYHMVTGTRPWEQLASNMQVAFAVQSGKRPSLEGVRCDKCPALLQFLVRVCFHEDPDRRPVVQEALSILESVKDRQGWEEGVPSRTSVTDPVYTFFLPPVPEESPTWQFLSNMTVQQYLDLRYADPRLVLEGPGGVCVHHP